MKKFVTVSLIAVAALGLSACGKQGGDNVVVNEEVVNSEAPIDVNGTEGISNVEASNEVAPAGNEASNASAQ